VLFYAVVIRERAVDSYGLKEEGEEEEEEGRRKGFALAGAGRDCGKAGRPRGGGLVASERR
jgi:hypothetical protein